LQCGCSHAGLDQLELLEVGGGGRPKSVLYGIWNVERLSVDGQAGPPESPTTTTAAGGA
jgi:hypothetical protein